MAVDVPSGVSTSTGEVVTDAFRAELTVSFQCEKLGCVLYPGKEFAGEVKVTDIGVDVSEMPGDRDVAYRTGAGGCGENAAESAERILIKGLMERFLLSPEAKEWPEQLIWHTGGL